MSIRPLAFIDASAMTAALLTRHKDKWVKEDEGLETIALRELASDDDDETTAKDTALLREWKSAMGVLSAIRKLGPALDAGTVKFGMVWLERFAPGGYQPWTVNEGAYPDLHYRLELCLVPSPGAWTYSGGVATQPPVGMLLAVDNRVLFSSVNYGAFPWLRLIADIRKPETDDASEA